MAIVLMLSSLKYSSSGAHDTGKLKGVLKSAEENGVR